MSDAVSRAIYETLLKIDPEHHDPGDERNVVDGLFAIAQAIDHLAQSIEIQAQISAMNERDDAHAFPRPES